MKESARLYHIDRERRKSIKKHLGKLLVNVAGYRKRLHLLGSRPINEHNPCIDKMAPLLDFRLLEKSGDIYETRLRRRFRSRFVNAVTLSLERSVGISDARNARARKICRPVIEIKQNIPRSDQNSAFFRKRQRRHSLNDMLEH